jgi:uncharacterized protein YprB with RNaseH-like and TPR domain
MMTILSNYQANEFWAKDAYFYASLTGEELDAQPLLNTITETRKRMGDRSIALPGLLPHIAKREVLFLDIETSGTARYDQIVTAVIARLNGEVKLEAYAALNPWQERGLLKALASECANSTYLITHGGTSFDLPFLEKRLSAHGLGGRAGERETKKTLAQRHLDLVGYARKVLNTPDFALQTLEEIHLKYTRRDDLPGRKVPAAYEKFLEEGNEEALTAIIKHNARDTLATLALFCYLADREQKRKAP